jgi:hypothetical protein
MSILAEVHVWLSELETEELYRELLAYFGLIGATDECQALERAWKDPYNKREIEEFIKEAIRFKLNALRGRYEYIEKPKKMRKAAKIIGQLKAYL